ncbi:MAG: deoxyribodipyrimidine photolyase [Deltaproteobacteria bacterium]|nr:deoxyribodipyrimidine photolyase [Deltaproteobacteria bacterium]
MVPTERIRSVNRKEAQGSGDFVLYWMTANRRLRWNYSLDRALEWCRELNKPLLLLEPLRIDYPWASLRMHKFVVDGMMEHAEALAGHGVAYYPYLEEQKGAASGLLEALAHRAAVVVADEFPCFFLPRMVKAAGTKVSVLMEAVDSNGLFPLAGTDRNFHRAYDFRRFLQKHLPTHLLESPDATPLSSCPVARGATVPAEVTTRWPPLPKERKETEELLSRIPIDQQVRPTDLVGGEIPSRSRVVEFLDHRLSRYEESRNQPEVETTSGLSPYLHFGHISVHEVFQQLTRREDWNPSRLADSTSGKRTGWWGMSSAAESFLDQIITWRELGYQYCAKRPDHTAYSSLPDWARHSLAEHAGDERPYLYTLEEFDASSTHDPIWNAAQNELRERGAIHGYLRMLWGKKILHWSRSPQQALEIMIELNNRYSLDGRNPNSYSGIFWILGRFDRAWGPERPIFGKIRYMSSANTKRKIRLDGYLRRWGTGSQRSLL